MKNKITITPELNEKINLFLKIKKTYAELIADTKSLRFILKKKSNIDNIVKRWEEMVNCTSIVQLDNIRKENINLEINESDFKYSFKKMDDNIYETQKVYIEEFNKLSNDEKRFVKKQIYSTLPRYSSAMISIISKEMLIKKDTPFSKYIN